MMSGESCYNGTRTLPRSTHTTATAQSAGNAKGRLTHAQEMTHMRKLYLLYQYKPESTKRESLRPTKNRSICVKAVAR